MKLDKETVSTIESALVLAEVMKRNDALSWLELARKSPLFLVGAIEGAEVP